MKNSIDKFKGLGVAVVTPFTVEGKVDFQSLENLVENLIQNKVDYLLALGTTSEYPTMSKTERQDIVRCITSVNAGRVPVLMGLGGPNTQSILDRIKDVDKLPIDAILSVTPY